jgi:hypothetical protein
VPGNRRLRPYIAGCFSRLPSMNLLLPPRCLIRTVCHAGRPRTSAVHENAHTPDSQCRALPSMGGCLSAWRRTSLFPRAGFCRQRDLKRCGR